MIIVYGGTFNPPTTAHENIANILIEIYKPNKFILLPVGDKYTWKDNFASFDHRKKMLELVFKEPMFGISTIENSTKYKGTYWALNNLNKTYKDDIYFVLGADNIDQLDEWINYDKLLNEYRFIVLTRKGFSPLKTIKDKYLKYLDNFDLINIELDVSSSSFRKDPTQTHLINNEVYKYIKENNLYEVTYVKT